MAYPQQCLNVTASDYNDTSNDTEGIGEALLLSDITVNGFRVSKQNVSIKTIWISLGKQQWGYIEQIKLEPISFLISLQSLFIVLAHSYGQAPIGTWTFHSIIKDAKITGFQLTAGQYNSEAAAYLGIGGYWLIIGTTSQQWGYSAFIYGGKKVTFPIPYAVQCYGVVSQNIQTTTDFIVCAINDVDITGFWDSNGSALGIYWFAYGKQQWGEYDVSAIGADTSTTTIVPLLISMANTNYVVCISKHKIGTAWSHTSPTLTEKELEKFTVVTWNNYSGSAQPTTQMYLLVGQ